MLYYYCHWMNRNSFDTVKQHLTTISCRGCIYHRWYLHRWNWFCSGYYTSSRFIRLLKTLLVCFDTSRTFKCCFVVWHLFISFWFLLSWLIATFFIYIPYDKMFQEITNKMLNLSLFLSICFVAFKIIFITCHTNISAVFSSLKHFSYIIYDLPFCFCHENQIWWIGWLIDDIYYL